MTDITMENHNFSWVNPLFLWWCSIDILVYQRLNPIRNHIRTHEQLWFFIDILLYQRLNPIRNHMKTHETWWFSIDILVYQRLNPIEKITWKPMKHGDFPSLCHSQAGDQKRSPERPPFEEQTPRHATIPWVGDVTTIPEGYKRRAAGVAAVRSFHGIITWLVNIWLRYG